MKILNERLLSIIATTALLGGSLFLGSGAAMAAGCPAGQHMNAGIAGAPGFCSPDGSGGGTGGAGTYNGGASGNGPAPAPIQVPTYNQPVWTPPAYTPPPAYRTPAAPAAPAGDGSGGPQAPIAAGGGYRPAAAGQAPAYTAPGGVAILKNDQGVWVDPSTGEIAEAGVAAQAEAAAAAPVEKGNASEAAAHAAVEVQEAKIASVEKAVNTAFTRRQIESAVAKALDNALLRLHRASPKSGA
ncbi:hypothetical protein [Arthrobacter sp. FW306-04-A]|uniref:hypothetical protein n=1 Tax=Arthrobacter sp. FW306-04-A TaxID=2879619 RepID=UPI0037BEA895|nr:hypothetical protein LFT43_03250 [Arthrobacter sp. FW306-04-A]